ncbi:DUF2066 domain-containing protein [Wenzhouxiangella sediminis]|uniref:DUF2066 domain-containing protein n=1 Tax=Wenzhouxiangella sediminis TaxID=1792836 RepID=A0A3E1KA84_9GAMM|nr:DUF2066 domain-containing protein [Wenzhouxiangella sediminis]RFF31229.1 DUF2066 domain-containing protein [Wenzhouxiangella sediminis]
MPRLLPFLACFLLFAAPAATASLYTGEVPVETDARTSAAEQLDALDLVLARLTGRFGSSLVAELGLGAGDLDDLVLSQQLVRRNVIDPEGEPDESLRLQVDFDEPSINELLERNDLPRWGRERPAVLLWAVIEDDTGTRFVEAPRLEYVIRDEARRVGLDLVRPLRDAMDLGEISLQDVRGGFLGSAEASARRYGAGVVAMLDLRLQESDPESPWWTGRWRWRVEGQESGLNHSGEDPEGLIRSGIERLASALAARYAVADLGGESSAWLVTVDGIVDEVQYAEVLGYLGNLSVVDDVRVVSAAGRQVTFEVVAGGQDIETYLGLGGLLELERRGEDRHLHFRFAR